jgi:ComF family protein
MTFFDDFLSLIYPRICMSCGKSLYQKEECICTFCLFHLPKTNFHLEEENPVSRLFWGKVNVHSAASFYYFSKGGKVQKLMHNLKYKGHMEIGVFLGKQYGKQLIASPLFNTVDYLVPVPMHRKKQKARGYNQSELIAVGLSESMNVPVDLKTLLKITKTESQTRKSRFSRWENVKEVFELRNADHFANKHILLVDDVITTGATLEGCIVQLSKVQGIRVSVASIACAYS